MIQGKSGAEVDWNMYHNRLDAELPYAAEEI